MRWKIVCLWWMAFHLTLVLAVGAIGVTSLVVRGFTIIPIGSHKVAAGSEREEAGNGTPRALSKKTKDFLVTYLHCAGIEGAYGFFAPNVPESFKLAFEFRNPDGTVEDDLPHVSSRAAELRLGSLLDKIGRSDSEQFRRVLIRMLTASAWKDHPEATSASAVFGRLNLPTPDEYLRGIRPSHEVIVSYDFERAAASDTK